MTEAEWLGCEDPHRMLDFLNKKATGRKLRLFACGCSVRLGHLSNDSRVWEALMVASLYADGQATTKSLDEANRGAFDALLDAVMHGDVGQPTLAIIRAIVLSSRPELTTSVLASVCDDLLSARYPNGSAALSDVLRCLFGNPFSPKPLNPAWLGRNGRAVPKLAQAIYADHAFDRLPILADALEDAGCADAVLLGHLRGGGGHVRGCWALDVVLGKK